VEQSDAFRGDTDSITDDLIGSAGQNSSLDQPLHTAGLILLTYGDSLAQHLEPRDSV